LHFDQYGGEGRSGVIPARGVREGITAIQGSLSQLDIALSKRFGNYGKDFKKGNLGIPDTGGTILEFGAINSMPLLMKEIKSGKIGPETLRLARHTYLGIREGAVREGLVKQLSPTETENILNFKTNQTNQTNKTNQIDQNSQSKSISGSTSATKALSTKGAIPVTYNGQKIFFNVEPNGSIQAFKPKNFFGYQEPINISGDSNKGLRKAINLKSNTMYTSKNVTKKQYGGAALSSDQPRSSISSLSGTGLNVDTSDTQVLILRQTQIVYR